MYAIFALLSLASMFCIFLGLIKPTLVLRWGAKRTRLRAIGWYMLFMVVFGLAAGAAAPKGQDAVQTAAVSEAPRTPAATMGDAPASAVESKPDTVTPPAPAAENKPAKSAPMETKAPTTPEFKKGMDVAAGNFTYVVDSVKYAKRIGNSMVNETADGVFLLINMTVRNNDKETHSLNSSEFTIKDTEGTEYDYSQRGDNALLMTGGKTFFLKQCQPKIPTKGTLIFEVPKQGNPYFLVLSTGVFSEPVKIALQ